MAVATRSSTRANAAAGPSAPAKKAVADKSATKATKATKSKSKKGKEVDRAPLQNDDVQDQAATLGHNVVLNEHGSHGEPITEEEAAKEQQRKEAKAKKAATKAKAKARVHAAARGNAEFVAGCSRDVRGAGPTVHDEEDDIPFPDVGGIRYEYPPQAPLDASDATWLEQMMAQFRREQRVIESHMEDSHMIMAQVTKELILVKAELLEERQEMTRLLNLIEETAGQAFLSSMLERLRNGEGALSAESDLEEENEERGDREDSRNDVRPHWPFREAGPSKKRGREDNNEEDEDDEGGEAPRVRAAYKRRRLQMQAQSEETPLLPYQPPEVREANGWSVGRWAAMDDAAPGEQTNASQGRAALPGNGVYGLLDASAEVHGAASHAAQPAAAQLPMAASGSRRELVLPPSPASVDMRIAAITVLEDFELDKEPFMPAYHAGEPSGAYIEEVGEEVKMSQAELEEDAEHEQVMSILEIEIDEPEAMDAENPDLIDHGQAQSDWSSSSSDETWDHHANGQDNGPADGPVFVAEPLYDPLNPPPHPDSPPPLPAQGASRLRRHDTTIIGEPSEERVWMTRGISDEEHRRRVDAVMGISLAMEQGIFDPNDVSSYTDYGDSTGPTS